jgi:TPR repeat protein
MKAKKAASGIYSVIDPAVSWKLPRLDWGFPKYPYKMSGAEWKDLVARAKLGDADAEWRVGGMYDDGCKDKRGRVLVRCNARLAREWYRRAAEHGSVSAQIALGVILGGNYGVKRNTRAALFWLKRAFRGGDTSSAANNIAVTYRESEKFREAVRWFKKAVRAGDVGDWVQLGIHLYWGNGVRADHAAAVRLFRKAIRGKNLTECERDDANFYLAIAYLEGQGVRKSLRAARKHLEVANRDNDHLAAQRLLKQMKELG